MLLYSKIFYFRFSYNVVYFALCHIYSGLATIPDSVSIVELATIADMLGLEGLKEAIMFTLKAKYCHHFHKVQYSYKEDLFTLQTLLNFTFCFSHVRSV